MKYLLIIIGLLVISCGPAYKYKKYKRNNPVPQAKYVEKMRIDSIMIPLLKEWMVDCYEYDIEPNISHIKYIEFTDTLRKDYAGLSTNEGIVIQDIYKNEKCLKVLFYHEMSHCAFGIGHDTTNTGIMAPYFIPIAGEIYLSRWDYYLDGYFEFIKKNSN